MRYQAGAWGARLGNEGERLMFRLKNDKFCAIKNGS